LTLNLACVMNWARRSGRGQLPEQLRSGHDQTLLSSKDGSVYDKSLVNLDRNNFAPRIGVAYTPTARTVIRAGYGVSYVHFNRLGGENLLAFNGPHVSR